MKLQELKEIALKWKLKIQNLTPNQVMERIYNHQNNQIIQMHHGTNDKKFNKFHCGEKNPFRCTL